jgi:hypothetical protein
VSFLFGLFLLRQGNTALGEDLVEVERALDDLAEFDLLAGRQEGSLVDLLQVKL